MRAVSLPGRDASACTPVWPACRRCQRHDGDGHCVHEVIAIAIASLARLAPGPAGAWSVGAPLRVARSVIHIPPSQPSICQDQGAKPPLSLISQGPLCPSQEKQLATQEARQSRTLRLRLYFPEPWHRSFRRIASTVEFLAHPTPKNEFSIKASRLTDLLHSSSPPIHP